MRRASVLIPLLIATLTVAAWWLLNRPSEEPAWPTRIQGFSFAIFFGRAFSLGGRKEKTVRNRLATRSRGDRAYDFFSAFARRLFSLSRRTAAFS